MSRKRNTQTRSPTAERGATCLILPNTGALTGSVRAPVGDGQEADGRIDVGLVA